jgi:hypothetical protein
MQCCRSPRKLSERISHSSKEAVEEAAAKSVGQTEICKKGKWYTERQEALEELAIEYNWALELITDFNYHIDNLTSKAEKIKKAKANAIPAQAQEEVKPEPKKMSTEEPEQNNNEETEGEEEDEQAQTVNLEPQKVLKASKTSTKEARDMQNPTQNLLQNEIQNLMQIPKQESMQNWMQNGMQNSVQNFMPKVQQAQWKDANGNSAFFLNLIQKLEGIINNLEDTVKDLECGKKKYKTKYQKQKVLTADAEHQLWQLKEEKHEAAGVSRDQQNLLQNIEVNHQQLLGALREGFSGVTTEILRAK